MLISRLICFLSSVFNNKLISRKLSCSPPLVCQIIKLSEILTLAIFSCQRFVFGSIIGRVLSPLATEGGVILGIALLSGVCLTTAPFSITSFTSNWWESNGHNSTSRRILSAVINGCSAPGAVNDILPLIMLSFGQTCQRISSCKVNL